jgi:hypothetical protein
VIQRFAIALAAAGFIVCGGLAHAGRQEPAALKQARIFEHRTYTPGKGKFDDLMVRFRTLTCRLMEKHGVTNIALFAMDAKPGEERKIIYILAHKSREAAAASNTTFRADPEWKKGHDEGDKNGVLVEKMESVFMEAMDVSKLK